MALSSDEVTRGERIDNLAAHLLKKPQYESIAATTIHDIATQIVDSADARKNDESTPLRRAFG